MALFINQDENRSELQKRLAAELQEKMKNQPQLNDAPDGVDDSEYIKGTKKTTSLAAAWIFIIILASALIIGLVFINLQNN